ncbi:MAG TPA: methionine synthase [Mycobacteriales bacterium]|nr:methionine synthase [Mycobacteriales bacterium]
MAGVATGVGSLPGDDVDRALALVFDELPDLPHLPELPARGPGADMIGRTATQLDGLAVDLQPSGWRLQPRPGLDVERGRVMLARDLDALLPVAGPGYDGWLKLQLAGPWTLAAALELPRGNPAISDAGAVRDLVAALCGTVRDHLIQVRRRVPGARLVLQFDEPGLPGVLAGRIPTASGLGRVRATEASDVEAALRDVVEAAGDVPVAIHCCHAEAPLQLLQAAGATAVGIDLLSGRPDYDALGELVEAEVALWLGAVPGLGPGSAPAPREVAEPVRRLWRELGFAAERLPDVVALTPSCGLAGASEGWAHSAYRILRQAMAALTEAPEGVSR